MTTLGQPRLRWTRPKSRRSSRLDTTVISGSVTNRTYTINGLSNNPDGSSRSWVVTYDKPGVGPAASEPISVSDSNVVASPNLTPVPNTYKVSIPVVVSGSATPSVTVLIGGTPATVGATPGTYERSGVPETFTLTWSVSAGAGWVEQRGTVAFTGRADLVLPTVTLVPRTITVTVSDSSTPVVTDLTTATFEICTVASPPASNCPGPAWSALSGVTGGTGGVYTFTAPVAPGTYRIRATAGGQSGDSGNFTVATSGAAPSTTSLTITALS